MSRYPIDHPRNVARIKRERIYFGGKPCEKDETHDKGRYTVNGTCVVCAYETNLRSKDRDSGVKRQKEVLRPFNQFRAFMFGENGTN